MAVNPDIDAAKEIVRLYWEEGLSKKAAVKECGHYKNSTAEANWTDIWAKGPNGEYLCDNIGRAMREYQERVQPFVRSRLPELIDEYMDLAKSSTKDKEKRKSIQFLLETVGKFSKRKEIEIEKRTKFEQMGAEEFIEYLETVPGVYVDKEEFVAGIMS